MRPDDEKGKALQVLREFRVALEQMPRTRLAAINEARAQGATLAEVGDALGITRQSVHAFLLYHGEGDVASE